MKENKKKYSLADFVLIPLSHAPLLCAICLLQVFISGLIPTIQILVNANFINLTIKYFNNEAALSSVIINLILVVILIAYQWLSGIFIDKQWLRLELQLLQTLRIQIVEKQAKLEYKHMEDPKTCDLILRVCSEPEIRFINAFKLLMNSVSLIMRIVGVLIILLSTVWWSAVAILAFSIPMFYLSYKGSKASYDVSKEVSQNKRRYEYLSNLLTSRESADERVMFDYKDFIVEKWNKHFEIARLLEFKAQKKWFIKLELSSVITAFVAIAIIIFLLNPVIKGVITFGIFASLIQSCFNIVQIMSWDLNSYIDGMVSDNEYIKEFTTFMHLSTNDDVLTQPAPPFEFESLELENVSFKYPGTDTYILKNLSLKIEKNKHYAFVGKNGAGKTTVIKLMTGLYNSYEGIIRLNNQDIRNFSLKELKAVYSIMYQDFARYGFTLRDNIRIGNINRDIQELDIEKRLDQMHLTELVHNLPDGLENVLGKMTEKGQDLSGGQWQRVAITRAMVSEAPLKILDEPTAALDPIAESEIYQEFGKVVKDKTAIFISHRLGSTKMADIIYVFDNGKIVESDSFHNLMLQKGLYYEMYESQKGWYHDKRYDSFVEAK